MQKVNYLIHTTLSMKKDQNNISDHLKGKKCELKKSRQEIENRPKNVLRNAMTPELCYRQTYTYYRVIFTSYNREQ